VESSCEFGMASRVVLSSTEVGVPGREVCRRIPEDRKVNGVVDICISELLLY
jgi:hypothetical protein